MQEDVIEIRDERYDESIDRDKKEFSAHIEAFIDSRKEEDATDGKENDSPRGRRAHEKTSVIIGNGTIIITLTTMVLTAIVSLVRLFSAFLDVNVAYARPSVWVSVLLAASLLLFMVSTAFDAWNYGVLKKLYLIVMVILFGVLCLQFYYSLVNMVVVPLLLIPKPNVWVTAAKWMFLIRALTIIPTLIASILTIRGLCVSVFDPLAYASIDNFRLLDHIDLRKHKKYLYDAVVVRRRSTGHKFKIRENSRYEHVLINGASGTAKTSSVITPMANGDLKKRCLNEDILKKSLVKMMEEGKVFMNSRTSDTEFSVDAFSVTAPQFEAELDELKSIHKTIGLTIMAPDDSLTDDIYELCVAKGIKCNRVDPVTKEGTDGEKKEGFVAFNPLYISPKTPSWQLSMEIIKHATLFADVLQAIQDMKGKSDPYFTSLNRSVTVAFSICLCATFEKLDHRQPTPADVQRMVNDFGRIKPYYEELVRLNMVSENVYGFVCDFIANDCLGPGREKMNDQARGLRNSMNEFLTHPLIKRVLCPNEGEPIIDMDKMLSEGQVTVVNFAKKLGDTDSKGFGMFFLLSFLDAVYRRPGTEKTRIPHVLFIDELPEIIHPKLESAVSQFRKFRCSIVMAIQSLKQMEKNDTTKYLKGTFMEGCAHHFLFGRCSTSEMREYAELAGKEYVSSESTRISETALSLDDPNLSYSVTETTQEKDVMSPTSIRNRHFQEITMFSVVNGNIITPFVGKVNFLKPSERNPIKRVHYDWDALFSQYGTDFVAPDEETEIKISSGIPNEDDNSKFFDRTAVSSDNGVNGTETGAEAPIEEITDEVVVGYKNDTEEEYSEL